MLRMPRIDDSHTPFKRKASIGPGPMRAPKIHEAKVWVCEKPKKGAHGKKGYYTQACVSRETGQVRFVRRSKKAKKKYNKLYRAWVAKKRVNPQSKPARRSYRCRRTNVARCR